jgi:hypothetical protein
LIRVKVAKKDGRTTMGYSLFKDNLYFEFNSTCRYLATHEKRKKKKMKNY